MPSCSSTERECAPDAFFAAVPRDLFFVINYGFDKNFFDFVGEYRIRYVIGLVELREAGQAILEVMSESGFNTAFKQKNRHDTDSAQKPEHLTGFSGILQLAVVQKIPYKSICYS